MPLILGVDSSLTGTGLARIHVTTKPIDAIASTVADEILVHTVRVAKPKTKTRREYSRRISQAVVSIDGAMDGVDMIMMEELAYGAKGDTAFVLPWIWGRIIDCAEARDIPIGFANTSQVKKYGAGSGTASKDQVMAAMIRRFPDVNITNDNESDALCLALIACRAMGYPIDHPTIKKEEVMAALKGFASV